MKRLNIQYEIMRIGDDSYRIIASKFAAQLQRNLRSPLATRSGYWLRLTRLPSYIQKRLFTLATEFDPARNTIKVPVVRLAPFFTHKEHYFFTPQLEAPFEGVELDG
jgi:hypothetical protein